MWSVYLDPSPVRFAVTRALSTMSRRACFSPFAPLRTRSLGQMTLPGRRWVRVRNIMAGIADDEVARVYLEDDLSVSPMALPAGSRRFLGRETVGEVIDVGQDVEFMRVGDRVVYQLDQSCATRDIEPPCRHCAAGNYGLCENRFLPGQEMRGGGWGDEMLVHERQLFLVPDSLADEEAALLEPATISLHAVLRRQPQPSEHVLVIGSHTHGLLTTQAARALAPNANITVYADHAFQIEMATRMGATRILYQEDGTAGVARITGGRHFKGKHGAELLVGGFDVIYDTVGSAKSLRQALRWVRGGGTVVLVGRHMKAMHLDLTPVWHQEVTLLGAGTHGTEMWPGTQGFSAWGGENGGRVSTFALTASLIREKRLTPQRLITHRFPLREVRRALAVAHDREEFRSIKVLLDIRDVAGSTGAIDDLVPEAAHPQPAH